MEVNMIVAVGKDGAIGKEGNLIWKIPGDLQRFKAITTGHPVIMGRKTWDSLPKKPLPGRRNIILSRKKDFKADGAETVASIEEALDVTRNSSPFIIGGAEIYKVFMPYITTMYLTVVNDVCPEADARIDINIDNSWDKIEESASETTPDGFSFRYVTYKKVNEDSHHQ